MNEVKLEADYPLASDPVVLSVVVGNGQFGSSVVHLKYTEKGRGEITDLEIGSARTCKGKKLTVKSVVTDVRDETNNMVVTYVLKGGVSEQSFTSSGLVEREGGSLLFRAVFHLKG